jgi:hypothetical protein
VQHGEDFLEAGQEVETGRGENAKRPNYGIQMRSDLISPFVAPGIWRP